MKPYKRNDAYDEPIAFIDATLETVHANVKTPEDLKRYHELMGLLETAELSHDIVDVILSLRGLVRKLDLNHLF